MAKKLLLLLIPTSFIFFSFYFEDSDHRFQQVNPVIGDESFVEKFGFYPDENVDDHLRIKTHLEYVEGLLRNKDVSHLSSVEQANRIHLLDLLHEYWLAGIFPSNYDYVNLRKPCFIDRDQHICAVGYLVEQTAGIEVAELINEKYKYAEISEMQDDVVQEWIKNSGLTLEECAMIQPTYGYPSNEDNDYIPPANGITSAVLSGANISLNTINAIHIANNVDNNLVPIIGLVTGTSQVILGAASLPSDTNSSFNPNDSNESLKTLCFINIGIGTSSIILSTWNLLSNEPPKEKLSSWNIHAIQTNENSVGMAFTFTRSINRH